MSGQTMHSISLASAFSCKPPKPKFLWPGFLAGEIGALIAPSGAGKSFWALEAAMAVAGGDILGLKPQHTGRVLYLATSDPEPVLIHRIHAIGKHLTPEARQAVAENLTLEPATGSRAKIWEAIKQSQGAQLIVLDTTSRLLTFLDENNQDDPELQLAFLQRISVNTGASILYLHTCPESPLHGAAHWRAHLTSMTAQESVRLGIVRRDSFVRLGVAKQEGEDSLQEQWYERGDGGVLLPAALTDSPRKLRLIRNTQPAVYGAAKEEHHV